MTRRQRTPMVGRTIGALTVLERLEPDEKNRPRYKCQCECGKVIERAYASLYMAERAKLHSSCGCQKHRYSRRKVPHTIISKINVMEDTAHKLWKDCAKLRLELEKRS